MTNTAAETDVFNETIPAAALGTNGRADFRLGGLNVAPGTTHTVIWRIYVGGVKVFDDQTGTITASQTRPFQMDFRLRLDTTSSGFLSGHFTLGGSTNTTGYGDLVLTPTANVIAADVAADFTGTVDVRVTAQMSTSGVGRSVVVEYADLELDDGLGTGSGGGGGVAWGDITGKPTFNADWLTDVDTTGAIDGTVLKYDEASSTWQVAVDDAGGEGSSGPVTLSAGDRDRLDLIWWGIWASIGIAFAALIAPRFNSLLDVTRGM